MKGYEYQSDFAKKYVALGRAEGMDLGRAEGMDLGRAEGMDLGRAEEAARSLLTVLRVRGVAVSEAVRGRILAERDTATLERWLERAVLAASIGDVLGEAS